MTRSLAPVALFVYNRLENTKEVISALQDNILADETNLFIFSDGPRDKSAEKQVHAIRKYLKTITGFKSITIIEREENFYIEKNIIEGVTQLTDTFGKVIVIEDDGVTSRNFLKFMNDALDIYDKEKKIMHIAAFTFIKMPDQYRKTFIWRYSENGGGGWATWKDRWEKFQWFQAEDEALALLTPTMRNRLELNGAFPCLSSLKLRPIPWDICWYIAITRNNGLCVNSPRSLIKNNGLFNGTHFNGLNRILGRSPFEVELDQEENIEFEMNITENPLAIKLLAEFYSTLGKRKRDRILHNFVRLLVKLKITKLLKKIKFYVS